VRRGHWTDRLPAIDQDLKEVEAAHFEPGTQSADVVSRAMEQAVGRPLRSSFQCTHRPPQGFRPGSPVSLTLTAQAPEHIAVKLRYRRVNQAERWQSLDMRLEGSTFRAGIPGDYTDSPFPLEYYFELRRAQASPGLYPGFNEVFANQPYFVLQRG
jgi:hypothetical protein